MVGGILSAKLSKKIPGVILASVLLSSFLVGILAFVFTSDIVHDLVSEDLKHMAEGRRDRVKDRLDAIDRTLLLTASSPQTRNALSAFTRSWQELGQSADKILQKSYITDNPHPAGQKEKLDKATTGSQYDAVHGQFHPWYRDLLEQNGFYDVFIINKDGDLVYSVFKETDFATNMINGRWQSTDLANAFRKAISAGRGTISFFDFRPYGPSADAPASFIATAIHSDDGQPAGALVFQLPNIAGEILANRDGLGELGEFVVVGSDMIMRNNSPFADGKSFLQTRIEADVIQKAINGQSGIEITQNYRGMDMKFAAVPLQFHGIQWVVAAVVSVDEFEAPVYAMRNAILLTVTILVLVLGGLGLMIARGITKPMAALLSDMKILAKDDPRVSLSGIKRPDEIGDMSRAMHVFKENTVKRQELEQKAAEERQREERRQTHISTIVDGFRGTISGVLGNMRDGNQRMLGTADTLSSTAYTANEKAANATNATLSASQNVQTVASAAEQLSGSIREIAQQSTRTYEVVGHLRATADKAQTDVSSLAHTVEQVGAVVGMIRDIAEQTNLLALNATIEAARAGESGKGFAVVASEVKELSTQTAKATEEIANQINSIQISTQDAVAAIGDIGQAVSDIDDMTASIAASADEQDAATQEISKSIALASNGSGEASSNVEGVSEAIDETSQQAEHVRTVSENLSQIAGELSDSVEKFLFDVSKDVEERRRALRVDANDPVLLNIDGKSHDCILANRNNTGFCLINVPASLKEGQLAEIDFQNGQSTKVSVVWVKGNQAGFTTQENLSYGT